MDCLLRWVHLNNMSLQYHTPRNKEWRSWSQDGGSVFEMQWQWEGVGVELGEIFYTHSLFTEKQSLGLREHVWELFYNLVASTDTWEVGYTGIRPCSIGYLIIYTQSRGFNRREWESITSEWPIPSWLGHICGRWEMQVQVPTQVIILYKVQTFQQQRLRQCYSRILHSPVVSRNTLGRWEKTQVQIPASQEAKGKTELGFPPSLVTVFTTGFKVIDTSTTAHFVSLAL